MELFSVIYPFFSVYVTGNTYSFELVRIILILNDISQQSASNFLAYNYCQYAAAENTATGTF